MMERRDPVSTDLIKRIEEALARVDAASAALAVVEGVESPLLDRRAAHTELRQAFDAADALLREATSLAKRHSFGEWTQWRSRLSQLDDARQAHLFAERDDMGVLRLGSVRAIDTGMSGPAIGELQHGETMPPGSPATYGIDLDARLTAGPPVPAITATDPAAVESRAAA